MTRWRRSAALLSKVFDLHLPYLATTLHLRIEFALWACTLLLASASSTVLYKRSYLTTGGDWTFLLWVGTWLGRHFLVRLACTIAWVCPPRSRHPRSGGESSSGGGGGGGGVDHRRLGGSWRRRRAFETWLSRRRGAGAPAGGGGGRRPAPAAALLRRHLHRLRYLLRILLSPYGAFSALVRWVQSSAMAGQYCDESAANGVASAAMMMLVPPGGGGGGGGGVGGMMMGGE